MRLKRDIPFLYYLSIVLLLLLPTSCSVLAGTDDSDAVCVTLPAWPPDGSAEFPPLDHYQVQLVRDGGEKTFDVSSGASIMVETDKGEVTAVIVQPVTRHGECLAAFFHPAGCVLPAFAQATWVGGFAASVCADMLRMANSTAGLERIDMGGILASFNWARFAQTVEEKCIDTKSKPGVAIVCDPWTLNVKGIRTKILSKEFTATSTTPTTAKDKRTVQTAASLVSANGHSVTVDALLPRYIGAYGAQRAYGWVRLVSDKYAEGADLKSPNMFLCAQNLIIFSVAINSKYEATVEPLPMPLRDDVLAIYGIAP